MIHNILVAVANEEKNAVLVNYAAKLAKKFNSKVWIIHIAAPEPEYVGYEGSSSLHMNRELKARRLRMEHRNLQNLAHDLNELGIDSEALLIEGPTIKSILDEAQKLEADLLIVGNHRHSSLYNVFFENTSLELLKKAHIPLLTIPIELPEFE